MNDTPLQLVVVQKGEEEAAPAVADNCCSNKGVLVPRRDAAMNDRGHMNE